MSDFKNTKDIQEVALSQMDTQAYEDQIQHLTNKIDELQKKLDQYQSKKPQEEEIIETEIRRLHDSVVGEMNELDPRDLKKFETLVKCLVQLRGTGNKSTKKKSPIENKSTAELLNLLAG